MSFGERDAQALAAAYTAAWNTGRPEEVARFFAPDGRITINGGVPWTGRAGVADMASGFFADIPDLALVCDAVRASGHHLLYLWTFTGTHAATGKPVRVAGWEEWDLDGSGLVTPSRGWFDAESYARQTTARGAPG
ncbi:MAG TPA: nuclear transport factor 2 family protein [Caulobacteraceae bacterium]|nr:nuclear transport factor 2 family protein [Caulobacteraceae bacterium]